MSAELVGPLPTVTFRGGGVDYRDPESWPKVAYEPPRNTCDPRYDACTEHQVACDCREAEFAEERQEQRGGREILQRAAWSALAGHQADFPMGLTDVERITWRFLCRCTGCTIYRATHRMLLPPGAVDVMTGRVQPGPVR